MRWSRDEWLVQPKPSIVLSLEDLLVIRYSIVPINSTGIGTDGSEPQKDKYKRSHLETRNVVQRVVEERDFQNLGSIWVPYIRGLSCLYLLPASANQHLLDCRHPSMRCLGFVSRCSIHPCVNRMDDAPQRRHTYTCISAVRPMRVDVSRTYWWRSCSESAYRYLQ